MTERVPTFMGPLEVTKEPGLSVSEDRRHFYVDAEFPGVDPKKIDAYIRDGVIYLSGEVEKKNEGRYFSYEVAMPAPYNKPRGVKAEYKNGTVHITLGKVLTRKKNVAIS